MPINIMEMVNDKLRDGVVGQIGGILGESENRTRTAIKAAIPSLLRAVVASSESAEGAAGISRELGRYDHDLVDDFSRRLEFDHSRKLIETGTEKMHDLLGSKSGKLARIVGRVSGLGTNSSHSVLGMMTPLVMGVISKQKKELGLDTTGLQRMLADQHQHIEGILPAGLDAALEYTAPEPTQNITAEVVKPTSFVPPSGTPSNGAQSHEASSHLASSHDAAAAAHASGHVPEPSSAATHTDHGHSRHTHTHAEDNGADDLLSFLKFLVPMLLILGLLAFALRGCDSTRPAVADGDGSKEAVESQAADTTDEPKTTEQPAAESIPEVAPEVIADSVDALPEIFTGLSKSLGNIKDVATAKTATESMNGYIERINVLSKDAGGWSEEAKIGVGKQIEKFMPAAEKAISETFLIPGVKDIVEPVMSKLFLSIKSLIQ